MHQDIVDGSMNSSAIATWRMLIDRQSSRIVACTPLQHFKQPDKVVIVNASGVHLFSHDQCALIDWSGSLPKGFTAQTCFRFRLDSNDIVEVNPHIHDDAIVL